MFRRDPILSPPGDSYLAESALDPAAKLAQDLFFDGLGVVSSLDGDPQERKGRDLKDSIYIAVTSYSIWALMR